METNLVYQLGIVLLGVLATALTILVRWGIKRGIQLVEEKLDIDIPDSLEAQASMLAPKAVGFGEEYARKYMRKYAKKVPSHQKLDAATQWFKRNAQGPLKEWSEGKIRDYLEAALGEERGQPPDAEEEKTDPGTPTPDWAPTA